MKKILFILIFSGCGVLSETPIRLDTVYVKQYILADTLTIKYIDSNSVKWEFNYRPTNKVKIDSTYKIQYNSIEIKTDEPVIIFGE